MISRLFVTEEASDYVDEIAYYYEQLSKGLGFKFIDEWDKALSYIQKNPLAYQKQNKHYRCVQVEKFPYVIVYEYDAPEIIVYRLIHVKQDPGSRYRKTGQV